MKWIVLFQIFFIWLTTLWIYMLASRRDGRAPIDDIGIWWLGVLLLYSTLPPLAWLVQGSSYGPLSGRLFKLQPNFQEVEYVLSIAIAYMLGFALVFLVLFKFVRPPLLSVQPTIDISKLVGASIIILFSSLIGIVLTKLGIIRSAESYADSYAVIYELPRGLRQFIKIVAGLSGVSTLVLVVAIFQSWPKYRFLFICYLFSITMTINPQGGRGGLVTALLSMAVAWHVLIRPIPTRRVFFGGFIGLLCFLVFGIWRNISSLNEVGSLGFEGIGVGEFDSLWGNAIELLQAKNSGGININLETRFGEIIAFIPSQLLWFEKISLNDWYLNNFYPGLKDSGSGLVFGAISQAIIGGGIIEAFIRGAIIGGLSGIIMKWVRTPSKVWWKFPLHLYLLVGVFSGIRETTFIQFGDLVQTWFIAPVVISLIGAIFAKRSKHQEPSIISESTS